jgi:hypothetical protein
MPPVIKIAPKMPLRHGRLFEGMDTSRVDLEPGKPPPWVIPHCYSCGVPVDGFQVGWLSSPHYLPIEAQCHGQTRSFRIPLKDVLRASLGGQTLWVFTEMQINARARAR